MVSGLDSFIVNQTVHGYLDGHRILKCTSELTPSDLKSMLILSDASGSDASIPENGYITGYPLHESGFYAVGKTWSAPEVVRPGSVWTHTLLIDFADLARIEVFESLLAHFKRPSFANLFDGADYTKPKEVKVERTLIYTLTDEDVSKIRVLLWALYENPTSSIVTDLSSNSDKLIFKIWKQQWPRLRRSFRFCTLSFSDRSSPKAPFDLQFIPFKNKAITTRFNNSVVAELLHVSDEPWLAVAVDDVLNKRRTSFQNFLRSIGSEISSGREAFVPLCEFYPILQNLTQDGKSVDLAINKIEKLRSLPSTINRTVALAALNFVDEISTRSFEFLLERLDLIDGDHFKRASRSLGRRLLNENAHQAFQLADSSDFLLDAVQQALTAMSIEEVMTLLQSEASIVDRVLSIRPELFAESALWSRREICAIDSLLNRDDLDSSGIVKAVFQSERSDLIEALLSHFGTVRVLREIGSIYSEPFHGLLINKWLDLCTRDEEALCEYLSTVGSDQRDFIIAIARRVEPNRVPCRNDIDPWLEASLAVQDKLRYSDRIYLASFLIARCFRFATCCPSKLLAEAFDRVYAAAENSRFPGDAWDLLVPYLPRLVWFLDWDKCLRLRMVIADWLIAEDLPPRCLGSITNRVRVFEDLVALLTSLEGGAEVLNRAYGRLTPKQKLIAQRYLRRR